MTLTWQERAPWTCSEGCSTHCLFSLHRQAWSQNVLAFATQGSLSLAAMAYVECHACLLTDHMGAYFSKIGSDPYYANYERSFQRLRKDIDRLKVGLLNPALLSTNQFSRLAWSVGSTTVEITNQEESRAFCGCMEHAVLRDDYPVCSLGESAQSSFPKAGR